MDDQVNKTGIRNISKFLSSYLSENIREVVSSLSDDFVDDIAESLYVGIFLEDDQVRSWIDMGNDGYISKSQSFIELVDWEVNSLSYGQNHRLDDVDVDSLKKSLDTINKAKAILDSAVNTKQWKPVKEII